MRIVLFIIFLVTLSSGLSWGQINDPAAKKILDKLYDKYQSAGSISAEFDLLIESPEADENDTQEGKMIQQGEKHFVALSDYEIYNNGESIWVYLKESQEIQWTDADSEDSEDQMPNLDDILTMYRSGDFDYELVHGAGLLKENKLIEFTPVDKDVEFYKMSMLISTSTYEPVEFKIFQKDGTRYSVNLKNVHFGETFAASVFDFDESKYPGVHIEDLRFD